MSNLKNWRRLLAAGKVWRVFTTKLQSKLHKLNRSKAIKKPKKNQLKNSICSNKAHLWPPSLSFQSRIKRKRRNLQPLQTLRYRKMNAPVYVDQLFIEPVLELTQPSTSTAASAKKLAEVGGPVDQSAVPETSKGDRENHTADEMWESLVLASPQMHGINERAEEFITRFRAELQVQEMMDRRL